MECRRPRSMANFPQLNSHMFRAPKWPPIAKTGLQVLARSYYCGCRVESGGSMRLSSLGSSRISPWALQNITKYGEHTKNCINYSWTNNSCKRLATATPKPLSRFRSDQWALAVADRPTKSTKYVIKALCRGNHSDDFRKYVRGAINEKLGDA